MDVLDRLRSVYAVQREVVDSPAARTEIEGLLAPLLGACPTLARETSYLEVLRTTGGFHAYDKRVSFGLFGFGHNVTSLLEGEPLERQRWFRFADLMLPRFDENLVLSFDLSDDEGGVFATPGSQCDYARYAQDFEDLIDRVIALHEPT